LPVIGAPTSNPFLQSYFCKSYATARFRSYHPGKREPRGRRHVPFYFLDSLFSISGAMTVSLRCSNGDCRDEPSSK
jgi:hypothetical protein